MTPGPESHLAFEAPALSEELSLPPRSGRARIPTPLEQRPDIGAELGVAFFLKREDLIDDLGCGHKTRKLAYLASDALARGATVLISSGSLPSSQCVAVAASARQHGLRAHLIYTGDDQAVPDRLQGNYLIGALLGPDITWHERTPWAEWPSHLASAAEGERKQGEIPYLVEPGISKWPGLAGSIELGFELAQQLDSFEGETWIAAPAGSGGTCLGLSIAAELAGLPWRVAGICIGGTRTELEARAATLRGEAVDALGLTRPLTAAVSFYDGALGDGYDKAADADLELMVESLRSHQLVLDPNYMAKAYLGIRQLIDCGEIPAAARVVAVHTGGSLGIHGSSPSLVDWYRRNYSAYLATSGGT